MSYRTHALVQRNKACPEPVNGLDRKFGALYDNMYRSDVLWEAGIRVKKNTGAPGIDGQTIEYIEQDIGVVPFLKALQEELRTQDYEPEEVLRQWIPKPGTTDKRPLGIPIVKDLIAQTAAKLVLETIFETNFLHVSYGFRPGRSAHDAIDKIRRSITIERQDIVIDADSSTYFDSIRQSLLMELVERRVNDPRVIRLLWKWLKAGVMDTGQYVNADEFGTPQGSVISPLLSNLFLHEIDRQWCMHPRVLIVRFADDMLFLTQTAQEAEEVWETLQQQLTELDLRVNEEKSQLTTIAEGFRFLGFAFRERQGRVYFWPCQKAIKHLGERVRQTVRSISSTEQLRTVIKQLNRVLIGWCTYFRVGNSNRVFHRVDWSVRGEVCLWLRRKYRISWTTAKKRWNYRVLHDSYRLYRMVGKVSYL